MNPEEEILDAVVIGASTDLSAVACWLDLSGAEWCIVGGAGVNAYTPTALYDDHLDIAADQEPGSPLLCDLADEGFAVRVDQRARVARLVRPGSGHRLQVTIHFGPAFQGMPGRASRRVILGRELPVAALMDVVQGLLAVRADEGAGWHEKAKAEIDLVRLCAQHPADVYDFLPDELRASADRDRQHALNYPDGDGWGDEAIDPTPQLVATPGTLP